MNVLTLYFFVSLLATVMTMTTAATTVLAASQLPLNPFGTLLSHLVD